MLLSRRQNQDALEIYDERGSSLGSVTLPTDPRLFGPDKGTVYLQRTPPPGPSTDPAQAA